MGLRVKVRREINYGFENERKALKAEMSEYRLRHRTNYWDLQTQAENMHIEDFQKDRFQKQHNDMNRWRTRICRVSMSTKNTLKFLEKRNAKTLETMRMNDIRKMRESTDKRLMLDAMQME